MRTYTRGIYACVLSFSLGWCAVAWADAVTDWNANAGKAAIAACISPTLDQLHESRMYAMLHVAVHDAVNAITRHFRPYALDIQVAPGASLDAAVATAAHDVLVPLLTELSVNFPKLCIDAGIASVKADYAAALDASEDGTPKYQGIVIGQAAAAVILALRVADGADTLLFDFAYPQGDDPAALCRDEQEIRRGFQRGQTSWRRVWEHADG